MDSLVEGFYITALVSHETKYYIRIILLRPGFVKSFSRIILDGSVPFTVIMSFLYS
jgi:hypothetical protein